MGLLVSREQLLLQYDDPGNLAEAIIAAPRRVDAVALLNTAYAICAFERRCGPGSAMPYPPREIRAKMSVGAGAEIIDAGSTIPRSIGAFTASASSVWGKVRAQSVGAWKR